MSVHRHDRALWTDAELLAAVSDRDGAAFAAFYRRHLAEVLAYLRRETGDHELAADLAAEVFAAVLLGAGRYQRQTDSALPWVIGIARHKLLMSWRRGRVEARARRRLGLEPLALDELALEPLTPIGSELWWLTYGRAPAGRVAPLHAHTLALAAVHCG